MRRQTTIDEILDYSNQCDAFVVLVVYMQRAPLLGLHICMLVYVRQHTVQAQLGKYSQAHNYNTLSRGHISRFPKFQWLQFPQMHLKEDATSPEEAHKYPLGLCKCSSGQRRGRLVFCVLVGGRKNFVV